MSGKLIPLNAALEKTGEGAVMTQSVAAVALARAEACRRLDMILKGGAAMSAALRILRAEGADAGASSNTLRRWHAAWLAGGPGALADKRQGRTRQTYGWEARAIDEWNQPQRPAVTDVAWRLRQGGFASATESRVRRYLKSLPATVGGENTVKRAGAHHHRQNFRPYVVRDETGIDVGLIYEGDGHTVDVYVQHPNSGHHWRPELTVWLDVRSHFCAGFYLSDAESAVGTMYSLSRAFLTHDHVPAALHVDPGSGFKNSLMTEEGTGWLNRLGVEVMFTLPGNAKGKGLVEGWFRTFEARCGKRFDTFCGDCRTDDDLKYIRRGIKSGKLRLPRLREYAMAVAEYIRSYNAAPQRRLGCAPEKLWGEQLKKSPVHVPRAALLRPAEKRAVRRATITMFGRRYHAPQLHMVNGRTVDVEYDLTSDAVVWVNLKGRRVCEARLVDARPWLPKSRVEDLRQKRLAGQEKRLGRRLGEVRAQQKKPLDGQAVAVESLPAPAPAVEINPFDCLPDGD